MFEFHNVVLKFFQKQVHKVWWYLTLKDVYNLFFTKMNTTIIRLVNTGVT